MHPSSLTVSFNLRIVQFGQPLRPRRSASVGVAMLPPVENFMQLDTQPPSRHSVEDVQAKLQVVLVNREFVVHRLDVYDWVMQSDRWNLVKVKPFVDQQLDLVGLVDHTVQAALFRADRDPDVEGGIELSVNRAARFDMHTFVVSGSLVDELVDVFV